MTKREVKTRKDALSQLDESDKEFVAKLNKKERKKVLDDINEESPRKAWGRNFFNKKTNS